MDDDEDIVVEEVVDREPQIDSADPNERKLARKLRIERRLEAMRKQNMPEGEEEEIVVEKTLLEKQLEKSAIVFENLTIDGDEVVSNVIQASDAREVDRNEKEWANNQLIIAELEYEAGIAEEKFQKISEKWLSIMNYNDPLYINDEIGVQKEKCDDLIAQKDEMIAMLKLELNKAEIGFTKDQKKQTNDVETLAERIDKQVTLMRHAYQQELELLEDVIETEKQILLEANNKRWDELFRKRDQEEEINSEKKFQQLEEFDEICTQLRINHQEKHRAIKIKLGNDIEMLELELEKIKFLALINSEKLDYNYQILKKREDENIIIKSQQKRKINKLQDNINSIRKKTRDYLVNTNNQIEHLIIEVTKLQTNILDIEAKADHFSEFNDVKYRQVWEMNNKIASDLLEQILTTDRILHEQQMGTDWVNPEQTLLEKTELPSYISAMEVLSKLFDKEEEGSAPKIGEKTLTEDSVQLIPKGETMGHRRILKLVLKLIADKSGFLIEDRLIDVLKPYSDNEKVLIKIDNVFSALGIRRPEDVEVLLEYFLPYTHCPICMGISEITSADASEIELKVETLDGDFKPQSDLGKLYDAPSSATTELFEKTDASTIITDISAIMSAIHQPQTIIEDILNNFVKPLSSSFEVDETHREFGKETVSVAQANLETLSQKTTKSFKPGKSSTMSKLSCQNKHPLVISSVYILRALREFISKFYVARKGVITMATRLSYKRSTVSRLLMGDDVRCYWDKYTEVFSKSRVALWDGLMIGLQKYHEILKDRRKLNDEVVLLRRQNTELSYLLTCYQKDLEKKNIKPPCAMQRQHPICPKPLNLVPKNV